MSCNYSVLTLIFCSAGNRIHHMDTRGDNHPEKQFEVITGWLGRLKTEVPLVFLPDMGTVHIEFWINWHMIPHKISRLCNQWCIGLDQYFFPSCILLNYHHSEVMDFHHRHKSDSGNHCNHLDSLRYMDNLEEFVTYES